MARSPLFCMRSLRRPLNGSCTSGFSGVFRSARRSLFCCLCRRHITEEFINGLTWKEVTSISILMLFVFAFSNLSFFLSGSPFSGRVQEDIFAIRTLADGFGIAVYWGFQINISELLTQKELYAMRHVLSSQYEQFRNYQESDEMLHMMQHDLKHQIEGLRGETNEQKKEAWLDQIEHTFCKTQKSKTAGRQDHLRGGRRSFE